MKRRLISLVLLISALLSVFAPGFAVFGNDSIVADIRLPHRQSQYEGTEAEYYSLKVKFDESFFADDAVAYDSETSIFSIALAMSAFNVDTDETEEERTEYLREFYDAFGFTDAEYHNYDRPVTFSGNDSAYSFASRTMSDGSALIAVVCRGSGYGAEWASNMCVAPFYDGETALDGYHRGFGESAALVYGNAVEYIKRVSPDTKNVRVIATGFSRGAAIANLTASMLCGDSRFDPDNIFAYCFATPANVRTATGLTKSDALYPHIYNILNPADIVVFLVSDHYGFERYGSDIYLPSYYSCEYYSDFMSKVSFNCVSVFEYNRTEQRLLTSFPEVSRAARLFIDTFLCEAIPTIYDYSRPRLTGTSIQQSLTDVMAESFSGKGGELNVAEILSPLLFDVLEFYLNLDGEDGDLLMSYLGVYLNSEGVELSNAFDFVPINHMAESYLSMLLALEALGEDPSQIPAGRTRVTVGPIKADSSVSLECGAFTGEPSEFWIENGQPFTLNIDTDYAHTALNEKRELSVRVERYDDAGKLEYVKVWDELPFFETALADVEYCSSYTLTGGDSGSISLRNGWGISKHAQKRSASYGNAFRAYPNDSALGEVQTSGTVFDVGLVDYNYNKNHSLSYITGRAYGLILDGRFFIPKVRLTAAAYEGSSFMGWYENGELLGEETEIELTADRDREIIAVFERIK